MKRNGRRGNTRCKRGVELRRAPLPYRPNNEKKKLNESKEMKQLSAAGTQRGETRSLSTPLHREGKEKRNGTKLCRRAEQNAAKIEASGLVNRRIGEGRTQQQQNEGSVEERHTPTQPYTGARGRKGTGGRGGAQRGAATERTAKENDHADHSRAKQCVGLQRRTVHLLCLREGKRCDAFVCALMCASRAERFDPSRERGCRCISVHLG